MIQDPNSIVQVQVSTVFAPSPSTLQQTGAIVSFGATNLPASSQTLLTQFSDLTAILDDEASGTITSATWATGVVTLNISTLPEATTIGSTVSLAIAGMVPTGYNGIQTCTVVSLTSVTYPLVTTPGVATTMGTWQLASASELNAQVATFFRQGSSVGVWVLELGSQTNVAAEVTALETWINNSTGQYYGYLLPAHWGYSSNLTAGGPVMQLFAQFNFPEAMTYFWVTIDVNAAGTATARGLIDSTNKSVIQLVEAPSVAHARASAPIGTYAEFTIAGMFYWAMRYKATAVTRVAPMCFKYIYGVTPYPLPGNSSLLTGFAQNAVNYIQTGAQGGIAYTNIYKGVTADGFDYFNWWWTLDWVQINIKLNINNAVVNGTNNALAPLYYDQLGVTQLESVLAGTMITGSQYGLVNGPINQTQLNAIDLQEAIAGGVFGGTCNVNAVPFLPYSQANPSDYGTGTYNGLSVLFVPSRGFVHILVTVVATNIVTL